MITIVWPISQKLINLSGLILTYLKGIDVTAVQLGKFSERKNINNKNCNFSRIFTKHNQTCNIWTHLLPTIFFLLFAFAIFMNYTWMFPFPFPQQTSIELKRGDMYIKMLKRIENKQYKLENMNFQLIPINLAINEDKLLKLINYLNDKVILDNS